jgi:tRNA(Ile)-lysidine synthase
MDVVEQVRETIRRYDLFTSGETVVVGVSGGPDSLTLLHVLLRLRDELGIALHVAHLDHAMRPESPEDARFVKELAEAWGLPVTVARRDVPALAREWRLAPEEAARRARYEFLAEVAHQVQARTVAVAHNADDQVETVLMHLLRGSGLAGLRGMQPLSPYPYPVPGRERLRLVRPLLEVPRPAIEAYCREHGLQPRFDRSNLDTTFFRNRLRHELIPTLETYNPGIREILRRTARVIADDYDYLRRERDRAWEQVVRREDDAFVFDLARWKRLHPSLKRGLLRKAVHLLRPEVRDITWTHIENALAVADEKPPGSEATLPAGLALFKSYDSFAVGEKPPVPDWPLLESDGLPLQVPGVTPLPNSDWQVTADVFPRSALTDAELHDPDPWHSVMDAAVAGERLFLRRRRPGDVFHPLGMGGHTKSVAEFMIGARIPVHVRDRLPLVVDAKDEIVWLPGWRLDERVRITEATKQVLRLRFEKRKTH